MKTIVKHNDVESLISMGIMVFILINYNMFWNFGLAGYSIRKVLIIYPFIFLLSFVIKTWVSMPLTAKIHNSPFIKSKEKIHVTFPLMVLVLNSVISLAISTYFFHNYVNGHFMNAYLFYWFRTIIVSVPLFFYLVRPQVSFHVGNMRTLFNK